MPASAPEPVTIATRVGRHARSRPDALAYTSPVASITWLEYDRLADALAATLRERIGRGERLAVRLPDGPAVHVAFLAAEKAGIVVVGIGWRAGVREVAHLLRHTGACGLVTAPEGAGPDVVADLAAAGVVMDHLVRLEPSGAVVEATSRNPISDRVPGPGEPFGLDELFLLNSTSGTTGMPKCVMHDQRRWIEFHRLAVDAAELRSDDVFMSVVPAPFGFGIWTAHVTPTLLGSTTVVMERFSATQALDLIAAHEVTVLCAVSTQFIMMVHALREHPGERSTLRALFTGGETVPYARAEEFEERTGAKVLQFYGSNETGALSHTTLRDSRAVRLGTAGRVIEDMQVRLFDEDGADITTSGGPGQPGCKGAVTCLGYYDDDVANAELLTSDGWMLTGDLVTIDDDGCLRVVGRKSDFIIRGGKNISARAVEEAVAGHPDVELVAAVAMSDEIFGERVCAYVTVHAGASLGLDELLRHLEGAGISKEIWPERLEVLDVLPESSGGKVAKALLREDIERRLAVVADGGG